MLCERLHRQNLTKSRGGRRWRIRENCKKTYSNSSQDGITSFETGQTQVAIGYCCSAKWCNGLQLTQSVGSLYSHQPAVTSPSESGLQIGNWLRSHWIHCIDRLGGCDYLSRYSKQLEMRSRKREQVKESDRLRVTRLIEDAS